MNDVLQGKYAFLRNYVLYMTVLHYGSQLNIHFIVIYAFVFPAFFQTTVTLSWSFLSLNLNEREKQSSQQTPVLVMYMNINIDILFNY